MIEKAPPLDRLVVAVMGGTGALGRGLGRRLVMAGHEVVLGSRDAGRAREAAADVARTLGPPRGARHGSVSGADNLTAVEDADVVLVAVPWDGHAELVRSLADALAGRIVVDCVNPLGFDAHGPRPLDVPDGSAAQQAAHLAPHARWVAAFHHVSAPLLLRTDDPIDCDVLVAGDDVEAKDTVIALAGEIAGLRGIDAGPLRLARELEALTAVLIAVNKRYRAHAGLRVTDI